MTFETDEDEFAEVCPYLGLADDADSHATYATEAHRCYRLPNPTRIATGHQETYCLGANHVTCPVYLGEGVPGASAPAGAAAGGAAALQPPRMPQRGPAPATVRGPAPREAAQQRQRAGATPPGQQTPRPRRPPNAGTIGPRPRAGGVSMPVATVGLFALAIVVIVLAFAIQHFAGGGGGSNLTAADKFATTQAVNGTANAGKQTQPAGTTTAAANTTPGATNAANKTPAAGSSTTTAVAGGSKSYVVKAGDICSTIASDNGITLQQLEDANGLTDDSCTKLQVGQTLKLP